MSASPMQGNYTLSGLIGMELCRKTVGIIGTGAIGACAARIWHVGHKSSFHEHNVLRPLRSLLVVNQFAHSSGFL